MTDAETIARLESEIAELKRTVKNFQVFQARATEQIGELVSRLKKLENLVKKPKIPQ